MKLFSNPLSTTKSVLGLICIAAVLTGCDTTKHPEDPNVAFPLKVSTEMKSMTVDLTKSSAGLPAFVDDYLRRGKGAFLVNLTSGGEGSASAAQRSNQVTDLLAGAGLRATEVIIRHQSGAPGNAMAQLSYAANTVELPECGEFSASSSYNPSNKRHPDFGCATRRNLGRMVSNPGDLATARTMSDRPAPHSLMIVNIYGNVAGGPSGARGIGGDGLRTPAAGGAQAGTTTAAPAAGGQ